MARILIIGLSLVLGLAGMLFGYLQHREAMQIAYDNQELRNTVVELQIQRDQHRREARGCMKWQEAYQLYKDGKELPTKLEQELDELAGKLKQSGKGIKKDLKQLGKNLEKEGEKILEGLGD